MQRWSCSTGTERRPKATWTERRRYLRSHHPGRRPPTFCAASSRLRTACSFVVLSLRSRSVRIARLPVLLNSDADTRPAASSSSFALPQTAGGVFLPDTGVKKNEGTVVAVGPGALNREGKRVPIELAVGDKVLLPEYGGHTVKIGDEEMQLFREEDILGKFEA